MDVLVRPIASGDDATAGAYRRVTHLRVLEPELPRESDLRME